VESPFVRHTVGRGGASFGSKENERPTNAG
jgi:hypothetical protein